MEDRTDRGDSLLPYAEWTEAALRAVPREALRRVARDGLPGEHHFYINFRTEAAGVDIPRFLRERFPREMTIVLQHRFWDLKVAEDGAQFSVGLSFGGIPAVLTVPFAAITGFTDPAVGFSLGFAAAAAPEPDPAPEPEAAAEPDPDPKPQVVSLDAFRRRPPRE